ncbi:MAG: ATP-grasp domain-containing protein [Acidobacteriota bacterium]|nr:ATP-grasp domain-containing protein [Acidobacteriota bacterium]
MPDPPGVMLLDGQNRCGLGVVRALGRRGVTSVVGATERWAMAGYSRFSVGHFVYPRLCDDLSGAVDAVLQMASNWRPRVILPIGDDGWRLGWEVEDSLPPEVSLAPSPGLDLFEATFDKARLAVLAARAGVEMPEGWLPESWQQLADATDRVSMPVVLKPRETTGGVGIRRVERADALLSIARAADGPVPIVQEWFEGDDVTVSLLADKGAPLVACVYRTLRQWPHPYGPSVASKTIRDPEALDAAFRLVRSLGYRGIANLDFRRSRSDGRLKLLDFNARFGGTTEIALASGVDLAWIWRGCSGGWRPTVRGWTGIDRRRVSSSDGRSSPTCCAWRAPSVRWAS